MKHYSTQVHKEINEILFSEKPYIPEQYRKSSTFRHYLERVFRITWIKRKFSF